MNNEENNKSNKNSFIKNKLSKWSDQKILIVSMISVLLFCVIVMLSIKIYIVGMITLGIVGILFLIGIIRFFVKRISNSESNVFYFILFLLALIIISFGVYININESSLEEYAKIISQKAKAQHLEYGYMCISSEDETKLNIELKKNIKYKVIFNGDTIEKIYVGHDIKYYLNENGYSRGINIDLIDYTCK
mgnify:CR=1 FL=1